MPRSIRKTSVSNRCSNISEVYRSSVCNSSVIFAIQQRHKRIAEGALIRCDIIEPQMVEPFKVTSAIDRKRDKPLVQHRSRLDLQPMVFIRKRHENIARMHLMRRVVAIGNALAVQNAGKLILIPG